MEENRERKGREREEEVERRGRKFKQFENIQVYGTIRFPCIEQDNKDKSNRGNHYKNA